MEDKKTQNNAKHTSDSTPLRRKAEEIYSKRNIDLKLPKTEEEIRVLVHELQVHQIELELQNEELQRAIAIAEEMRDRFFDLYNFAPVGYFTFGENGAIREVNLAGADLLGFEREKLLNRRFQVFLVQEDIPLFNNFCRDLFETKINQSCEVRINKENMPPITVMIEGVYYCNKERYSGQIRATVIDISERKKAEAEKEKLIHELKEALDKVKLLSGLLPICSNCKKIRNEEGYWEHLETYISKNSEALFSYSLCPDCAEKGS